MCTVRCCPLWHPLHCPMGTVPRVLVRKTAPPAHADFGGLSSGAAPVVVRLDVVPLPPRSSAPTVAICRLGGYPAGRDRWGGRLLEGCPRTTTGVSQCWFSGHFRQVFFNTNALPRINIGTDVWGESSIMTGVYERWCSWPVCRQVLLSPSAYLSVAVGSFGETKPSNVCLKLFFS
jgi:hypothetical protein